MISGGLLGRVALVGGSTQGIGLASAQALAAMGATCVLISRNEEKLKRAIGTMEAAHGSMAHTYLVADYAHPEQVREVVSAFVEHKTIDILVNNTAGPAGGPAMAADASELMQAFSQHLICSHIITRLAAEGMKKNSWGRVINIISTSVKIPLKDLGVSNTIRGAVASWAKTMANELGQFGITVNNVLPGATATERLEAIVNAKMAKTNKTKEEVEAAMLAEIPARRFGKPEEIAAVVAFLASPQASYVNGVSVPVDGGRTGSI